MTFISKLKSETSFNMLIPAIVVLTGLAILALTVGKEAAVGFVAIAILLYALFSFSAFLRTRNAGYLIATAYQVFAGLWVGGLREGILHIDADLTPLFGFATIFLGIWLQVLLFTRRIKWRGREILELAAQPVEELTNGFTTRPKPIARSEYDRADVLAFARFMGKNLVVMPYVESDRVVLVPVTMAQSFRHLSPFGNGYNNSTWIAIDNDGNVSVSIAHKDYLTYKDALSFDQLCQSMGELFVEFVEQFRRNEGVRIIDRLNSLRMNPYT